MSRWPTPEVLAEMAYDTQARALVALGRAVSTDPEARAALDELERRGPWGRRLALMSCYGSRDGERIVAAMGDPSNAVRMLAVKMVARICTPEQALTALRGAPGSRAKGRLMASLRRTGNPARDQWLVERLGSASRDEAARLLDLLPRCSEGVVSADLERFADLASSLGWTRLAIAHPGLCVQALTRLLARPIDARVRFVLGLTVRQIAVRAPLSAIALLRTAFQQGEKPTEPTWGQALALVAVRRPVETFDLLRSLGGTESELRPPGAFVHVRFTRGAEKLGFERLSWLIRYAWTALPDGPRQTEWFKRLTAEERRDLHKIWLANGRSSWGAFLFYVPAGPLESLRTAAVARWRAAMQDGRGVVAPHALERLPADLRWPMAREMYAHPSLSGRPMDRLNYLSLIPRDEAVELAQPYLRHPEGEQRAMAHSAILRGLALDRGSLLPALAEIHAKRFEQDPVRRAMLGALASLKSRVWAPDNVLVEGLLPALDAVLQDAYDAADLSDTTAMFAESLVVTLFRHAPDWGAEGLERAWKKRGHLYRSGLLDGLQPAWKDRLREPLSRMGRQWCSQERWAAFSWLVHAIGRDLPRYPVLGELLGAVAREAPFTGYTGLALALLRQHDKRAFAALVPSLVQADPTFAVFSCVFDFLSAKRQDLLPLVVRMEPLVGRHATGKSVHHFTSSCYTRWNPALQEIVARQAERLVDDPERDLPTRIQATSNFPDLCWTDPAPLLRWANHSEQSIRETAVRGLARLDGPEALPALMEAMGDARARWAIYALRQVFARMDEGEVLRSLMQAPREKVTVAKEVIRLIGTLPGPAPYAALLELSQTSLHRDVRIALLRALWAFLEQEPTWEVYDQAVRDPNWVVASRLGEVPTSWLSSEADPRFCKLLAAVLDRPEREARVELLKTVGTTPVRDPERALFRAIVRRVCAPTSEERLNALHASFARMRPGDEAVLLGAIEESLHDPRAVQDVVPSVRAHCGAYATPQAKSMGQQILTRLAARPLDVVPALQLASSLLETVPLGDLIQRLHDQQLLGFDATQAALDAIGACARPGTVELRWRQSPSPALRRLALAALVAASRPGQGWLPERIQLLEHYLTDPSPHVAGAARYVLPPDTPASGSR